MNQLTIRHRLLLLTLLPSALIAIALVLYFTLSSMRTLEGELRAKGLATVRYLAPICEYSIIAGQIESLYSLVQATVQDSDVRAAIIVNQKGRAIAVSGRVSLDSNTLHSALEGPSILVETDNRIAFGAPIRRSPQEVDALFDMQATAETIGHVFVEFDKSELLARQHKLFLRSLFIVLLGLVVLAILAIAMADTLARPIIRLAEAVDAMSSGRLDTRVEAVSSGELGRLEKGFNQMASHIEEAQQSLQTRIEEATAQLAFQARHDELTGLFNRREFEHRLAKTLELAQAGGEEGAVLFIDLDRFKPVNDACGHLAGDELLRQISLLFQGRLREEDTLARLGGDEFGIILSHCSGGRARQVAEEICALANAFRFIWQDKIFAIGASIGLTPISRRVRGIDELISAADSACRRAKDSGRNQVCEQEAQSTPERREEHNGWASRITEALAAGHLLIEALPLTALQRDCPAGHWVELSARLLEPGKAPIALSALLDAAERYDLAPIIDLRFIEVAIDALAEARQQHKTLHCLVPLSRSALADRTIMNSLNCLLQARHIDGTGLCLLFSENFSGQLASQIIEFSRQARQLGCDVGLNDFGGGLASFSHLRGIAPRCVRLSRSLTRNLDGSRASTALLRAIQEITADQGILSIADGIDDNESIERLRELGIDYAIGSALAPCEPFEVWLQGGVLHPV